MDYFLTGFEKNTLNSKNSQKMNFLDIIQTY